MQTGTDRGEHLDVLEPVVKERLGGCRSGTRESAQIKGHLQRIKLGRTDHPAETCSNDDDLTEFGVRRGRGRGHIGRGRGR